MKVVVATGIWPPDVGGPASNAPEVAAFLHERGHEVVVLTTADATPQPQPYGVRWVPRSSPPGVRHARFAAQLARLARRADVVYTSAVPTRSAVAAAAARTPFVLKLTADPAFERARNRGLYRGGLDEFERAPGSAVRALRAARNAVVRRAARVVTPSEYLRRLALAWGVAPERVVVVPNPAPAVAAAPDGPRSGFVFAGRLTPQKSLDTLLEAVARVEDASLVVAGDGEERTRLERAARALGLNGRVRFTGALPRERVLELLGGAEALVLSSAWENFPHVVVEALALGTPVVSTDVGGVAEVVHDGSNGLLVPPGDTDALADALRRFHADAELRSRLRDEAPRSVEQLAPERVYAELERVLAEEAA